MHARIEEHFLVCKGTVLHMGPCPFIRGAIALESTTACVPALEVPNGSISTDLATEQVRGGILETQFHAIPVSGGERLVGTVGRLFPSLVFQITWVMGVISVGYLFVDFPPRFSLSFQRFTRVRCATKSKINLQAVDR